MGNIAGSCLTVCRGRPAGGFFSDRDFVVAPAVAPSFSWAAIATMVNAIAAKHARTKLGGGNGVGSSAIPNSWAKESQVVGKRFNNSGCLAHLTH